MLSWTQSPTVRVHIFKSSHKDKRGVVDNRFSQCNDRTAYVIVTKTTTLPRQQHQQRRPQQSRPMTLFQRKGNAASCDTPHRARSSCASQMLAARSFRGPGFVFLPRSARRGSGSDVTLGRTNKCRCRKGNPGASLPRLPQ
jgi:hypothetical protein